MYEEVRNRLETAGSCITHIGRIHEVGNIIEPWSYSIAQEKISRNWVHRGRGFLEE